MNINEMLYLADICEDVNGVCAVLLSIGIVGALILLKMKIFDDGSEYDKDQRKTVDRILTKWPILVLICCIGIFTPTRTTVYLMTGNSFLSDSNISPKVTQALELKLDKYISELKKGVK